MRPSKQKEVKERVKEGRKGGREGGREGGKEGRKRERKKDEEREIWSFTGSEVTCKSGEMHRARKQGRYNANLAHRTQFSFF